MAQIEVIGNAGGDAELKFIKGANGDFAVANFSLGETSREKKNGEWVNGETVWWKISVTGDLAEWCADQELKGKKLFIKGDLKAFEYTNKSGEIKSGWEVRAKLIGEVGTLKRKSMPKEQEEAWPF